MRLKEYRIRNITIKLWLTVTVLCLCLLMGAKPVQAYDESAYLYVNGTYLVKNGSLLKNKVEGGNGTATYDKESNTLTLDNFSIADGTSTGIAFQFMDDFKIVLKETNTLEVTAVGISMRQPKDDGDTLKICGGGTLNITAGSWETAATGIRVEGADLLIEECTMNISASYGAIGVSKDLVLKNSNIKAVRTGYGVMNDPTKNNNLYNTRYGFPGVGLSKSLIMDNSTLDTTGINYGISLLAVPTLKGKVTVTDESGNALNLVKMHWPASWMEIWTRLTMLTVHLQRRMYILLKNYPTELLSKP